MTVALEDSDFAAAYRERGYVVLEGLIDNQELRFIQGVTDRIVAQGIPSGWATYEPSDPTVISNINEPGRLHPIFDMIALSDTILDRVEALLGGNIVLQYSKVYMKAAMTGSPVKWHQELAHYPHTNADLLTAFVLLDDATVENGCLHVIPGSHHCGLLPHDDESRVFVGSLDTLPSPFRFKDAVPCMAPRGSLILLHCLTVHGSPRNASHWPRRTFIAAYRAADAFPIFYGHRCARNENLARLARGHFSRFARCTSGTVAVPFNDASMSGFQFAR